MPPFFYHSNWWTNLGWWSILRPWASSGRKYPKVVVFFDALIPYSISDDTFAFMGPFHGFVRKPSPSVRIFPSYHGWEPLVLSDKLFIFHFLENQVYLPPLLEVPNSKYINWLTRVEKKKKAMWKYSGIFELIQLLRVHLKHNPTMLLVATWFWESTTNTPHLPCGMLTPTLFDLATIVGLRPIREAYKLSRPCFWFLRQEFWYFYSGSPRFVWRYRRPRAYRLLNLLVQLRCLFHPMGTKSWRCSYL